MPDQLDAVSYVLARMIAENPRLIQNINIDHQHQTVNIDMHLDGRRLNELMREAESHVVRGRDVYGAGQFPIYHTPSRFMPPPVPPPVEHWWLPQTSREHVLRTRCGDVEWQSVITAEMIMSAPHHRDAETLRRQTEADAARRVTEEWRLRHPHDHLADASAYGRSSVEAYMQYGVVSHPELRERLYLDFDDRPRCHPRTNIVDRRPPFDPAAWEQTHQNLLSPDRDNEPAIEEETTEETEGEEMPAENKEEQEVRESRSVMLVDATERDVRTLKLLMQEENLEDDLFVQYFRLVGGKFVMLISSCLSYQTWDNEIKPKLIVAFGKKRCRFETEELVEKFEQGSDDDGLF